MDACLGSEPYRVDDDRSPGLVHLASADLGRADYLYTGTLRVPYGAGEEPDKRRAGLWYLGVQALDGAAEYTLATESMEPEIQVKQACTRLDRYCPYKYEDVQVSFLGYCHLDTYIHTTLQ